MTNTVVTRPREAWRPLTRLANPGDRPYMQVSQGADSKGKLLGLSVLSALSVAGVYSVVNPSYSTLRSFTSKPETRDAAIEGLWIGLGAGTVTSAAIWLVFGEWIPALVSQVTALGLFGMGYHAVMKDPLDSVPPIQNQGGFTEGP